MPPDAEFVLLRTAQEALANVAKHAQAARVGLTLSYMEHEVALDVRDNGRGFDPAQLGDNVAGNGEAGSQPAYAGRSGRSGADGGPGTGQRRADAGHSVSDGGFGLVAMRQRIEGLAGTLRVESEPGAGTAISACVPAVPAEARG